MIRLMTHNIWNCDNNNPAWEAKGEDCSAAARVKGLVRVYQETTPDVIGAQEATAKMVDLINETATQVGLQYAIIWGRFTPILYRADKFELLDTAFAAYPEHIEGMDGSFNDVRSKSWNLAVFREKATDKRFVFATTHLWWKSGNPNCAFSNASAYQPFSDEAREYQIALLSEQVKHYCNKYDCAGVLVGDLNTNYRSLAIRRLLAEGYRHAHDIATEHAEESIGYHNCFPSGYDSFYMDKPFEEAIDHILLWGDGQVYRFERHSPDYYFPISDHSAAYIDIEF